MAVRANWALAQFTIDRSICSTMKSYLLLLLFLVLGSLGNHVQHMIGPFCICCKIGIEVVGKEKKFENGKDDEELYEDDLSTESDPSSWNENHPHKNRESVLDVMGSFFPSLRHPVNSR